IETALRTLPDRIREILQQGAAFRTAGDGPSSGHVDRPRAERVLFLNSRWLLKFLFFCSSTGILIPVLPILAVRQKVPPEKRLISALIVRLWRLRHKRFFAGV